MRIAYADPPYPGCSHLYRDHKDYAGEVDYDDLTFRLLRDYDGWCLHTNSTTLFKVLGWLHEVADYYGYEEDWRVMAWVKPFAAFKRSVPVAYAWEPVVVKAARKPVVSDAMTYRDWIAEPITMQRGLAGAKPEAVCRWLFEVMGAEPEDDLVDLYPGTGAVTAAWDAWRAQTRLAV